MEQSGRYQLLLTDENNTLLVLNESDWYAIVEGDQGDLLVGTDSEHTLQSVQHRGYFYLVEFENHPKFNDQPHLFLEIEDQYLEYILPKGLPQEMGDKELVIRADKIEKIKVEPHLPLMESHLKEKTKDELYELAQEKELQGRSQMDKDELVATLS